MGTINFGPYLLKNKKGNTESVEWKGQELKDWQMYSLPFDHISETKFAGKSAGENSPLVKKGSFDLAEVGDTYLDMSQWGKGCVWVNGHHLGRYWEIGPQQTLYVPAEWLHKGKNEVVVFELLKPSQSQLKAVDKPVLNELNN